MKKVLDPSLRSWSIFAFKFAVMERYPVKKLAKIAGVSVRTLHHYDRIGLLKPSERTPAGYRLYGRDEMLRLQQILFYKELDFGLKAIRELLDDPGFDRLQSLENHRKMLLARKKRLGKLVQTITKTIVHLKKEVKMNYEELYEGLPKEQAESWRREAKMRWPGQVEHAEKELMKMDKVAFRELQEGFRANGEQLASLSGHDPADPSVQEEIARHYAYILQFWGKTENQAEAYKGLGDLYAADPRYTRVNGLPDPAFGRFMQKAIAHFVKTKLQ